VAWLSLDADDGELCQFVTHLVAANHTKTAVCKLSAHHAAGPARVRGYSVFSEVTHSSRKTGRRGPGRGPPRGPGHRIIPAQRVPSMR
jgi:hypothetical protein